MSQHVQPSDRRPLLFRRTTDYTQMAVLVIQGLDGRTYHVLYMGTGVYEVNSCINFRICEGQSSIFSQSGPLPT